MMVLQQGDSLTEMEYIAIVSEVLLGLIRQISPKHDTTELHFLTLKKLEAPRLEPLTSLTRRI